ncbi:MAG TPA: Hsp20/alpha crystallin family protein [Candidatus Sulfotelmatobacter sp.]|nr:Hsp20/alpha crystallin family protein [Candidatus Sulfotelmatobacter sp.]
MPRRTWDGLAWPVTARPFAPTTDVFAREGDLVAREGDLVVRLELPGIDPEKDVKVSVEDEH